MRGVSLWRGACVALCVCVVSSMAVAQLDVTVGAGGDFGDLGSALTSLASAADQTSFTITLIGEDGSEVVFPIAVVPLDWLADKTLTIRSDQTGSPQKVSIEGGGAVTMFTVPTGGTLNFEDVTLKPVQRAVLVSPGATLTVNRCLIKESGSDGISAVGGTVVIANSCFSRTGGPALKITGGQAFVGQSTFIDCSGGGISVVTGQAEVVLTLFHQNGTDILVQGGSANAQYCVFTGNEPPPTADVGFPIVATVKLAGDPPPWPGDLAEPIEAVGAPPLLAQLQPYDGFDFEHQPRNADRRQVGADEEGGGTGAEMWLNTRYTYELDETIGADYGDGLIYVGKGATIQIELEVNRDTVDLVDDEVWLVPESGSLLTGAYVALPLVADGSIGRATLTVSETTRNGVVMDGLATVYLALGDGTGNVQLFGLGQNEDPVRVSQDALTNSRLLFIDTVAPRLVLPELPDPAMPDTLLAGSSDKIGPNLGDSDYPSRWRPAQFVVPYNDASLRRDAQNTATPKLFFNGFSPLTISIRATFFDAPPANSSVSSSGFDPRLASISSGTVATVLAPDVNPFVIPYWVGDMMAVLNADNRMDVTYTPGDPGILDVVWTLVDIPPVSDPAIDPLPYWHMSFKPVARDRAKNVTDTVDLNALELWWMRFAQAELTSKFNGAAVPAPQITWKLRRPDITPTGVSPCDPIFRYRLWSTELGGGWKDATWVALDSWSDWFAGTSATLPVSLLNSTMNRRLLVTVVGADEAGNTQDPGIAEGDTLDGLAGLDEAGVQYDHWLNLGLAGTVDTTLSARVWHYNTALGEPDAFLEDFGGSGARVPEPEAGHIIVLGQFDVGVQASVGSIRRILLEYSGTTDQGASIAGDSIQVELNQGDKGQVTLFVSQNKEDAVFLIPDGAESITYSVRVRAEMDVKIASGDEVTVVDDTPETMSFTVYRPEVAVTQTQGGGFEEQTDEQPFKVFVRGEE